MSSLFNKVKDALSPTDHHDTEQSSTRRNDTPGSFPSDDVNTSNTHQHDSSTLGHNDNAANYGTQAQSRGTDYSNTGPDGSFLGGQSHPTGLHGSNTGTNPTSGSGMSSGPTSTSQQLPGTTRDRDQYGNSSALGSGSQNPSTTTGGLGSDRFDTSSGVGRGQQQNPNVSSTNPLSSSRDDPYTSGVGGGSGTAGIGSATGGQHHHGHSGALGTGATNVDQGRGVGRDHAGIGGASGVSSTAAGVPEVVQESMSRARAEPEAAAYPEELREKSALERELLNKTTPVAPISASQNQYSGSENSGYGSSGPHRKPVGGENASSHVGRDALGAAGAVGVGSELGSHHHGHHGHHGHQENTDLSNPQTSQYPQGSANESGRGNRSYDIGGSDPSQTTGGGAIGSATHPEHSHHSRHHEAQERARHEQELAGQSGTGLGHSGQQQGLGQGSGPSHGTPGKVYNTLVGHGSRGDDKRPSHLDPGETPSGAAGDIPATLTDRSIGSGQHHGHGSGLGDTGSAVGSAAGTRSGGLGSGTGLGNGSGGMGSKVVHPCEKCGHQNDISHYFGQSGQGQSSYGQGQSGQSQFGQGQTGQGLSGQRHLGQDQSGQGQSSVTGGLGNQQQHSSVDTSDVGRDQSSGTASGLGSHQQQTGMPGDFDQGQGSSATTGLGSDQYNSSQTGTGRGELSSTSAGLGSGQYGTGSTGTGQHSTGQGGIGQSDRYDSGTSGGLSGVTGASSKDPYSSNTSQGISQRDQYGSGTTSGAQTGHGNVSDSQYGGQRSNQY